MTVETFTNADGMLQSRAGPLDQKLRTAGVAGEFYPANREILVAAMEEMFRRATVPEIDGQILAVVAPHAGYEYSGSVAAHTYAAIKGRQFSRVVVIAPSHCDAFGFTSVYDGDGYVTPLGIIPVDKVFARELAGPSSSIQLSERGHKITFRGAEHAIEVQLPWLQHELGRFMLVPIVMGDHTYESSRYLGITLARLIGDDNQKSQLQPNGGGTLIVASSDLSHFHRYAEARKMDLKTMHALEAWDYLTMSRNFESRIWEACGGAPIVAAMIASERLGANQAHVLDYRNSGDVSGDRTRVVGYGASIFFKSRDDDKAVTPSFSLSEKEKDTLLAIARKSVASIVREHRTYDVSETGDEALDQERGAFVTLKRAGHLRGCIGYASAMKPLYEAVRDTAAFAAVEDPRFLPITAEEVPNLEYEISVLSPLKHVLDVQQIEVGRDGLLVRNGKYEGILLPQVAAEEHWDRKRFLRETCFKSGMPQDCLSDSGTDIFRFTAVVFGDRERTKSD